MSRRPSRPLVIGIGNPDRGDDAAGRLVAQLLRNLLPDDQASGGIEIVESGGEATGLLERLDGADHVFLVDACASGAAPGSIHRFDAGTGPLPQDLGGFSSHGFGPAAAVELARSLGRLPPRCIVYAVEGADFAPGATLSGAVAAAVPVLAARLRDELTATLAGQEMPCTRPR